MTKKLSGLVILCVLFLFIGTDVTSYITADTTLHYYTIDGFERPGEWEIFFSKFRAKKWNQRDEKPGDTAREPNKDWYDWFKADGTTFKRKEILPDFIEKNKTTLPEEQTILGIKARWDFAGYNWITLKPKSLDSGGDDKRYSANRLGRYTDQIINNDSFADQEYENYDGGTYILLPGQTREISVYVWGSSFDYELEFHIEDFKGRLYVLKAGSINFKGWHRISAVIPVHVRQVTNYLPRPKPLKLKRIKFALSPTERITGTYIYLDYLHGKTDTYLESFFGEGLENSQRIWKKRKGNTGTDKK
ncbi:MAG TPA: hypothetical protein ENI73_05700 [Spirochaetes bacterium]|nr:hypothetical protein [Spirochaetota bacterium]